MFASCLQSRPRSLRRFVVTLASVAVVAASVPARAQVCGDVDGNDLVTASDALRVLRQAVGLPADLICTCPSTTLPGGTTTTLPGAPFPANDTCSTATHVTVYPFADELAVGPATKCSDDPVLSCLERTGENVVWYLFTAPSDGTLTADTSGSSYDTILAAHTGVCGALSEAACNDDVGVSLQSQIVVQVTAGTTYHIEVASFDHLASGSGETLVFNLSFEPLP